jgi:lipoate-protein ligase A
MPVPAPPVEIAVEADRPLQGALRTEEELLRRGSPAVHVAVLADRVLSYGVGVPEGAAYLRRAREDGVAVVRRPSGGSGLVHLPGDLLWAVVLPRGDSRVGRDFVRAYGRLGEGVRRFLGDRDVPAKWVPAPGLVDEYCSLSSRGQVLASRGKVIAAAAQHATHVALLHHGVLPRRLERVDLARWFSLPTPGPADTLTCLEELGLVASAEEQATLLARALAAELEPGETHQA